MSRNRNSLASAAVLRTIPSTGHALRNIDPFTYRFAIPRRLSPEPCMVVGPRKEEGAGNAGCTLHPRSRVQWEKSGAHEHTGSAEAIRHSLRHGFTAYTCSPRRDLLGCRRHPQGALASRELATSMGAADPHDFIVRPGAFVSRAAAATASHTAFVTIAKRPSTDEMGGSYINPNFCQGELFLPQGLDRFSADRLICPSCRMGNSRVRRRRVCRVGNGSDAINGVRAAR